MSKTTKALAILGVVAGLGVSAMPMSAMAAVNLQGDNTTPATDEVTVKTTIKDFISIELKQGTVGDDGSFTGGVTDGTHTAHVLDLGNLTNGGAVVSGSLLVNVKTNNAKGYKLGITAGGTTLNGKDDAAHTIAAGNPAVGTSAWSFKIAKGGSADAYTTMTLDGDYTTYDHTIPTTNTRVARYSAATDNSGLDTEVTFGVSANASQAADEYSQTVTFTAATDATTAF